jgi:hypothetical protein
MADLTLPNNADDIILDEIRIAILVLLISTSAAGLQHKLNALKDWCAENFIDINLVKTVVMILGPAPQNPVFKLGDTVLSIKIQEKYSTWVHILTQTRNMLEGHYKAKASAARFCAYRLLGIEESTGRLTPKELRILYMARVDCHLIHGCEISPDWENVHVQELCAIQTEFLREILNVHSHSLRAPLFIDMAVKMPFNLAEI